MFLRRRQIAIPVVVKCHSGITFLELCTSSPRRGDYSAIDSSPNLDERLSEGLKEHLEEGYQNQDIYCETSSSSVMIIKCVLSLFLFFFLCKYYREFA